MEYQNPQPAAAPVPGLATDLPLPGAGRTVISETAVAKVAGIAARSVPGVYSLGSGLPRALGAFRDAVGSSDHAAGVRAEVGETQAAVDIDLVALYARPSTPWPTRSVPPCTRPSRNSSGSRSSK